MSMKRVDKIIRKVPNGPKRKRRRKLEKASCPLCGKIDHDPRLSRMFSFRRFEMITVTEHYTCVCGCQWDVLGDR